MEDDRTGSGRGHGGVVGAADLAAWGVGGALKAFAELVRVVCGCSAARAGRLLVKRGDCSLRFSRKTDDIVAAFGGPRGRRPVYVCLP